MFSVLQSWQCIIHVCILFHMDIQELPGRGQNAVYRLFNVFISTTRTVHVYVYIYKDHYDLRMYMKIKNGNKTFRFQMNLKSPARVKAPSVALFNLFFYLWALIYILTEKSKAMMFSVVNFAKVL